MKQLIVREAAESDLANAVAWYEKHRVGLGDDLIDEMKRIIQAVRERPASFPTMHLRIRLYYIAFLTPFILR